MASGVKISEPASNNSLDGVGIVISALCLVHCLVLPLMLALLPTLPLAFETLHEAEWIHAALLVPIVLISGPVLARGAQRDWKIGFLGLTAIAALALALGVESETCEQVITIIGSGLLIFAHILNIRSRFRPRAAIG